MANNTVYDKVGNFNSFDSIVVLPEKIQDAQLNLTTQISEKQHFFSITSHATSRTYLH